MLSCSSLTQIRKQKHSEIALFDIHQPCCKRRQKAAIKIKSGKQMCYLEGITIPAFHRHMLITWVELNTISIETIRSIWHNSAVVLRVGKFQPLFCESCGAIYRRNYEMFSASQRSFCLLTFGEKRPNRSISVDVIRLETLAKPTKTCCSEFGVRRWMLSDDAEITAIRVHNYIP